MPSTFPLLGLLLVSFGPVDVDEHAPRAGLTTTVTLSNRTESPVTVSYALTPAGWRTAAGPVAGDEKLSSQSDLALLVRGALSPALYPLPRVRTIWQTPEGSVRRDRALLVRKLATAEGVTEAPRLDGILSDDCWLFSSRYSAFGTASGEAPFEPAVEWAAAYGPTHFYFGATCHEPNIADLPPSSWAPDDERLRNRESVELSLNCSGTRERCFHLLIGESGAVLDEILHRNGSAPDLAWQSSARTVVLRGRAGYYVELSIPYTALGVDPPQPGTVWLINVARNRRLANMEEPVRGLWNPAPLGYHPFEALGALLFK